MNKEQKMNKLRVEIDRLLERLERCEAQGKYVEYDRIAAKIEKLELELQLLKYEN